MSTARLAVCSWSLQPKNPQELVEKLQATGIARVQLALDPLRQHPEIWGETAAVLRQNGVGIASGMVGCVGEDYSTMESIRRTGGIAPDATWEENQKNMRLAAKLAEQLGLKLVTFHAGFLPPDETGSEGNKMRRRLREVADIFGLHGAAIALETGQETADELASLLQQLDHAGIGVNFDPANMIMYDKGDPVAALRTLTPWIRQVHVKDARRTKVPGTWGTEEAVGTGEVDWPTFFAVLRAAGLNVDLAIERERGGSRLADIRSARIVVEQNFN